MIESYRFRLDEFCDFFDGPGKNMAEGKTMGDCIEILRKNRLAIKIVEDTFDYDFSKLDLSGGKYAS